MVDLYCERIGPELWAEPTNAITNLAFIISALAIWQLAARLKRLSLGIWILIILTATIGIGSGLFHTFATTWSRWLDIIPILLFQLVYLWLYTDKIINLNSNSTTGLLVLYVVAAYFGRQFPQVLNGSLIYAPAFLMLVGLGFYHYLNRKKERLILLVSLGVLMLSLLFRSIDTAICPYFPIGTHFLWHLLNGLLTYMLVRGLLVNVIIKKVLEAPIRRRENS